MGFLRTLVVRGNGLIVQAGTWRLAGLRSTAANWAGKVWRRRKFWAGNGTGVSCTLAPHISKDSSLIHPKL